jgi:hypothetical protein
MRFDENAPNGVAGRRAPRLARHQKVAPFVAELRLNGRKERRLAAAFNAFE